jgi:hypothetical protein
MDRKILPYDSFSNQALVGAADNSVADSETDIECQQETAPASRREK